MSPKPTSPQVGPRVFVAILILGIAILWFRRDPNPTESHRPAPATTETNGVAPASDSVQTIPTRPSTTVSNLTNTASVTPQTNPVPSNFAEEFQRCFPDRASSNNAQDFVRDLVVSPDLISREMSSENLHIQESGTERRLNIYENGPMYDVREFDVDSAGLPIPKDEPQTMTKSEAESFKEAFLRRGKTIYDQRKEVIVLNDGIRGELEWQDDTIHDLMLFSADRSFFCREGQCQCKVQSSDAN